MIKELLKTSAKITVVGGILGFSYYLGLDLGEKLYSKITKKKEKREAEIENIKKDIEECIELLFKQNMAKYQIDYEVYKEEN